MGIFKTPPSVEKIARKHKVDPEYVMQQLVKGIKVELEHTEKRKVAATIALHHLLEKPNYYELLAKHVE